MGTQHSDLWDTIGQNFKSAGKQIFLFWVSGSDIAEASHIVEVHSIFPVSFYYSVVPESLGKLIEIYTFGSLLSKVSTYMSVYDQIAKQLWTNPRKQERT